MVALTPAVQPRALAGVRFRPTDNDLVNMFICCIWLQQEDYTRGRADVDWAMSRMEQHGLFLLSPTLNSLPLPILGVLFGYSEQEWVMDDGGPAWP